MGSAHKADPAGQVQCPVCGRQYAGDVEACPVDGARLLSVDHLPESRVGSVLGGRYHIEAVLGHGGMGTVYTAVQQPIGRKVAVKVLHPDLAKDKTFVTRFHTEAKAASVLVNPNTVTIHDFGQTDDGTLYIAMEQLDGVSLADRLDLGPLPWRHTAAIGAQVCRALAEAHRKGIVHRDLKPENIMLLAADDGSILVKVLDFGIAKMLQSPGRTMTGLPVTQVGVIIGTPQYMSPEQAQGKEPSPASDLYALGVILFECIVGDPPFDHEEHILLLGMHIQAEPPPLEPPAGEIPPALRGLVSGLLVKDAASRPGPADHVGATLRQMIGGFAPTAAEVLEARPAASVRSISLPLAAVAHRPPVAPPPKTPPRAPPPSGAPPRPGDLGGAAAEGPAAAEDLEATRMVASPLASNDKTLEQGHPGPRLNEETALLSVVVEPVDAAAAGLRPDQVLPDDALLTLVPEGEEAEDEATPIVARPVRSRAWLFALVAAVVVVAGAATGAAVWVLRAGVGGGARPGVGPGVAFVAQPPPGPAVVAPVPSPGLDASPVAPDAGAPRVDGGAAASPGVAELSAAPDSGALVADSSVGSAPPPGAEGPPEMARIALKSRPSGAHVYRGEEFVCTTPCRTSLPSAERVALSFRRRGSKTVDRVVIPGRVEEVLVELPRARKGSGRPPSEGPDPFGLWDR